MLYYVQDGETVNLQADFRGLCGGHIDPDNITLKAWNVLKELVLEETPINSSHRISAGVYLYEFEIPEGLRGQIVYEFKGEINGKPIILRDMLEPIEMVDEVKHLNLYNTEEIIPLCDEQEESLNVHNHQVAGNYNYNLNTDCGCEDD
jgi:hypothetical protein